MQRVHVRWLFEGCGSALGPAEAWSPFWGCCSSCSSSTASRQWWQWVPALCERQQWLLFSSEVCDFFHQVFFFGFFFLPSERMILKCNTMWGWNSSRNTVRITVLESVKSVYYWIIFCSVVEKMWLLWMGRLNHELNWYFRCWVHQLFISESTQGIIKKIIIKKLIKLHTNELHFNCFSNA